MIIFPSRALIPIFIVLVTSFFPSVLGKKAILIAGNFSIDGVQYNIAEFDPVADVWRENYNSQVYLYNEETSGIIWDVALNETDSYTDVFAAGLFDTDAKLSQVQLCSVAFYESGDVDKVGEGLCSRGGDYGPIVVRTIVVGDGGDLFVGGNFESRVWDRNRHKFVLISHVARFDAASSSWLPLEGGGELLRDSLDSARVNSLLWDSSSNVLYLAGAFHALNSKYLTPNLAMWSLAQGLSSFPGGNVLSVQGDKKDDFEIVKIFMESIVSSIIIVGTFTQLNNEPCFGVAIWNRPLNEWRCLMEDQDMLISIDAVTFNQRKLYLAGPLVPEVFENKPAQTQYGIIYLSIDKYIEECSMKLKDLTDKSNISSSSTGNIANNGSENGTMIPPRQLHRKSNARTYRTSLRSMKSRRRTQAHSYSYKSSSVHFSSKTNVSSRSFESSSFVSNISSNSMSSVPINSPTAAPTIKPVEPWSPIWNWLPQLPFLGRKIVQIQSGSDLWQDSLFIALEDDNQPALLAWNFPPRKNGSGNISFIGGHRHAPYGEIRSIRLVTVLQPRPPTFSPTIIPVQITTDYTYIVVISCIGIGLILGAGIICTCMGYGNTGDKREDGQDDNGDEENEDVSAPGKVELGPISLKTLTDGQTGNNALDFKECFERAMKTRHLPTYETLVIINPKEILLSRIIGEGSFGRVWSGQWRNNAVAVKEFVFAQAAIAGGSLQRNSIIEEIVGEAGVMACLRHPKILQLYGCSLTMQAIWIVSELCLLGSLKMLLMNPKVDLPLLKRLSMLLDIADGMQYLHNRTPPIIHRDLKSHNIFIQETFPGHFVAKIGDWGSARAIALTGAKSMTQGVGTACWLSPEVINNAHFSKSSDVYAFGIILWEVYTRQEIYEGLSAAQIIAKVAHEGLRPHVPRDCPWSSIMSKCWRQDPAERPNFEAILSSLGKNFLKLTSKSSQRHTSDVSISSSSKKDPIATISPPTFTPLQPYSSYQQQEDATNSAKKEAVIQQSAGSPHSSSGNNRLSHKPTEIMGITDTLSNNPPTNDVVPDANEETSLLLPQPIAIDKSSSSKSSSSSSSSGKMALHPVTSSSSLRMQQSQQQQQPPQLLLSPSKRVSSRNGKFYDSFHPSLENIVTDTKTPFSSNRLSHNEESPAHLAPEIAQVEAKSLLAGQSYFSPASSKNNSKVDLDVG